MVWRGSVFVFPCAVVGYGGFFRGRPVRDARPARRASWSGSRFYADRESYADQRRSGKGGGRASRTGGRVVRRGELSAG
jgi:hypothetical protein